MITRPRATHRSAVAALIATYLLSTIGVLPVAADTTPQSLPFSQAWSNTGQITTDNDWSGVPGLTGYLGTDLTSSTGTDPQTVTAPDSVTNEVHVIANQIDPNTLTTGGFAEFETLPDPVVATQGSGTADAPFLLFALNTTGHANINIAYKLRDIDGSADNAVQPFALQYRVGAAPGYTNLPAGFAADATTGPSLATLVTPISVTLPAAADDQPLVEIRIITTNAVGSDEWVGIDDISVTSTTDGAPAVQSTTPANNAIGVATSANISVTFTEAVNASSASFTIVCGSSGAHTAGVSGGPTTFTLDPDSDFFNSESCTVTVVAAQVTDQDADDPPDAMALDHVFDFTTAGPPPTLVINEIDYDQPSTDTAEFLEIKNVGDSAASLNGVSINFVNGASGGAASYRMTALPDVSLPAGDYFVVCANAANTTNCDLDITPEQDLIQNGAPDAVALTFAGSIVDTVSYEGSTPGFTEGSAAGTDTAAAFESLSRCPDGTDTNNNSADFQLRPSTPGAANTCPGVDLAPSVISTTPANGAIGVALAANISVTFSEPVDVTGTWFTIQCATSGTHDAAVSGGPTTFILDPTVDFAEIESCAVTVVAAGVTDQDVDDPPNAMNANQVVSFTTVDLALCGDPATFVHDIQGSGPASPLVGQSHAIEGIVVGDYEGTGTTGLGGFFVQEEDADADADPQTSEGIFVFTGGAPPAVTAGDHVRVRGTVAEFSNLTELGSVSVTLVCATGSTMPTPTTRTLPVATIADWEPVEGMLVTIDDELTVTETFTLGRFGEVALSVGGRLSNPTNVVPPGDPAIALQALNDRSRILLDDGRGGQNADPTTYPTGGLSASNTLRIGDTVSGALTGVLDFQFGLYRIQPVGPIGFVATNPRPPAPADVGGNVRVASFNVLNYFNGDGLGGGFPTARGAETLFEFDRQRAKIVSAIDALDADIVGLMELENDPTPNSAIEDLVAGLNDMAGAGTYAFIDTGVVGGDAIRVALIYKPAAVTPAGAFAILDSSVDPAFIDTLNRPVVAQTFERNATGARLTVVVNHLKSKGSACPGDPDLGDGQGNCNLTRTAAAEALVDWLATDPTGSSDPDRLIIGDLNSYALEDPIAVIRDAGYSNLIAERLGDEAYSFDFQGQSGYLDHALSSPSLTPQVSGVAEWHVNADEPVVLDYNTNFKSANHIITLYAPDAYRSSDHDPVLVGLNLNASPTVEAGGPYEVIEGGTVTVTATGSDPDGDVVTYAWDLDGNGSFETPGATFLFSAVGLQAPLTETFQVQVTDPLGLTGTDVATVNVIWDFGGFLPPLDDETTKQAHAGKTIVVKFSLDGDQGLDIFRDGYPASEEYPCGTTPPSDAAEPATATGFGYDSLQDEYVFEWKTDKDWQGTCRVFVLGLADGTTHHVSFQFRETPSGPGRR